MKRILCLLAVALFAMSAYAEEPAKKPSCAGFVSNGFWDNWELSVGGGANFNATAGENYGHFAKRISLEGYVSATKWIHPVFGTRLQFEMGEYKNLVNYAGDGERWPFIFIHGDLMINFSNWVGGYRTNRTYTAIPYIGAGYMVANFTDNFPRRQAIAASYGLVNRFRLADAWALDLTLKGTLAQTRIAQPSLNVPGHYFHGFAATLGLTYRFNQRNWKREAVAVAPEYTADDIRAYQKAVADGKAALDAANADKARLAKELEDAKKAQAAPAPAVPTVITLDPRTVILYQIGSSQLSDSEKTRLDLLADVMKNGPKEKVYEIEGHADAATGTPAINKRLAEERAKNVYDYLINQGVSADQLKYEGKGDSHNPYNTPVANRVVVIM